MEREAEITKQREAAEEEYMNTLLQARIVHGSQGDSPRLSSTLHSYASIRNNNNNNEIDEDNNGGNDDDGGGGGDNDDDNDNDEEDLDTSERIIVSQKRSRKRNPSPNPPGKSAKKKQWFDNVNDNDPNPTTLLYQNRTTAAA